MAAQGVYSVDKVTFTFWDVVKLAGQLAVLVWGASTIRSEISSLAKEVTVLNITTKSLTESVNTLNRSADKFDIRISNLEKGR